MVPPEPTLPPEPTFPPVPPPPPEDSRSSLPRPALESGNPGCPLRSLGPPPLSSSPPQPSPNTRPSAMIAPSHAARRQHTRFTPPEREPDPYTTSEANTG